MQRKTKFQSRLDPFFQGKTTTTKTNNNKNNNKQEQQEQQQPNQKTQQKQTDNIQTTNERSGSTFFGLVMTFNRRMRAPLEQFYSVQTPLFSLAQASVWGGMAQWVQCPTEKPGAILTQGRLLGVARDFSSSQLPVQTVLRCPYIRSTLCNWSTLCDSCSCGNTEMWDNIAVGTLRCGTI